MLAETHCQDVICLRAWLMLRILRPMEIDFAATLEGQTESRLWHPMLHLYSQSILMMAFPADGRRTEDMWLQEARLRGQ